MTKIAFDVDGTLITYPERIPIPHIHFMAKLLAMTDGVDVIIWSHRGDSWAQHVMETLGIKNARVVPKWSEEVDIAFDDDTGGSNPEGWRELAKVVIDV